MLEVSLAFFNHIYTICVLISTIRGQSNKALQKYDKIIIDYGGGEM